MTIAESKAKSNEVGKWFAEGVAIGSDDAQLMREVGMMHAARKTPTPNELIEEEIETIERMKRDGVVSVHD